MYRPLKPFIINQPFGDNKACVPLAGGKVITCDGNNPPPGYKSLYGPKGHLGIDLYAQHGQPVYCAFDGVVFDIDTREKSGLDVKVVSEIEGKKIKHIYEHLLGYQPKIGDSVKAGELIGWADNTGWSAGDHLHYQEEELVNGKWIPRDPLPTMSKIHAQDLRSIKEILARLLEVATDLLRARK